METLDHRTRAVTGRGAVLVAALALALGAACSGDGDGDDRTLTESLSTSPAESESPGGDGESTGGGSASGEVLGTTRAQVVAGAIDDRTVPVRIDVTRLERDGELVELTLLFTNEAEAPSDGSEPSSFALDSRFGDGSGANARYDTSGIGLVDGGDQMLYLPAYDSEGNCLCTFTGSGGSTSVPPGESLTVDATIGGVPEDVEEADVRIPDFPTVSGVAIR
jgi:hypothetical protein